MRAWSSPLFVAADGVGCQGAQTVVAEGSDQSPEARRRSEPRFVHRRIIVDVRHPAEQLCVNVRHQVGRVPVAEDYMDRVQMGQMAARRRMRNSSMVMSRGSVQSTPAPGASTIRSLVLKRTGGHIANSSTFTTDLAADSVFSDEHHVVGLNTAPSICGRAAVNVGHRARHGRVLRIVPGLCHIIAHEEASFVEVWQDLHAQAVAGSIPLLATQAAGNRPCSFSYFNSAEAIRSKLPGTNGPWSGTPYIWQQQPRDHEYGDENGNPLGRAARFPKNGKEDDCNGNEDCQWHKVCHRGLLR